VGVKVRYEQIGDGADGSGRHCRRRLAAENGVPLGQQVARGGCSRVALGEKGDQLLRMTKLFAGMVE
jgi:hypothetical protein